jgi:hypothetical protein
MRRIAIALLLPLPFAALPLLALAFPATGNGTGDDALLTTFADPLPIIAPADEPLARRTSATTDPLVDCSTGDLRDQS